MGQARGRLQRLHHGLLNQEICTDTNPETVAASNGVAMQKKLIIQPWMTVFQPVHHLKVVLQTLRSCGAQQQQTD